MKFLKTILFLLLTISVYAQIRFEKGFLVDNNNQRKDVLIKNIDWLNNPKTFEYKLDENSSIQIGNLNNVKEFTILNKAIYKKVKVLIDHSSEDIRSLSDDINPEFREETIFLKQLVKGDANLYKYRDGDMIRYFYNNENHTEIEQLVYKMYQPEVNKIDYNKFYRTQILTHFKCNIVTQSLLLKVNYNDRDLTDLFKKINQCNNSEVYFLDESSKRSVKTHLNIRPRINFGQLKLDENSFDYQSIKLDRNASFGLGLELEFILPFNNNKWSIIIEPNYLSYKSTKEKIAPVTDIKSKWSVDYKSIDIPIGVRHYFYLNNQSKLFVNGMFIPVFSLNSKIVFERNANKTEMEIGKGYNYGVGFGYTFNNKYTAELRYISDIKRKDDIGNHYNNISFILGYNLF